MAHEELLGPTQHPLVGTPAILVSNQTEIRGYSDNGHDYSVLWSSLYMYNLTTETVETSFDEHLVQFSGWNKQMMTVHAVIE